MVTRVPIGRIVRFCMLQIPVPNDGSEWTHMNRFHDRGNGQLLLLLQGKSVVVVGAFSDIKILNGGHVQIENNSRATALCNFNLSIAKLPLATFTRQHLIRTRFGNNQAELRTKMQAQHACHS